MAASHSPHMGNGLLAESLETSIPMFGESYCFVRGGLLSLSSLLMHQCRNSNFLEMPGERLHNAEYVL